MEEDPDEELTRLLHAYRAGHADVEDRLVALLWEEIGARAARLMRQERRKRPDHSLETLALLNETWLRLATGDALARMRDGLALMQAATHIMRQILVDHARARTATKRAGGRRRVPLDAVLDRLEARDWDVVALHEALDELARARGELVGAVVWLRYVEEYEVKEVATKLQITTYRVERASRVGLDFLRKRLSGSA